LETKLIQYPTYTWFITQLFHPNVYFNIKTGSSLLIVDSIRVVLICVIFAGVILRIVSLNKIILI